MKTKLAGYLWFLFFQISPSLALGAVCEPVTLEGRIAFVAPEGDKLMVAWQSVRYLEIASLSPAAKKEYARQIKEAAEEGRHFITLYPLTRLEFFRLEIWSPNFYGENGRGVRRIVFLERGCRKDGEFVHTLLEPPELLFTPR